MFFFKVIWRIFSSDKETAYIDYSICIWCRYCQLSYFLFYVFSLFNRLLGSGR